MTNKYTVPAFVVVLLCMSFDVGAAGFVPLGDLTGGTINSRALGVSRDGLTVVGRSNSASGDEPFAWTSGGGIQGLGHLPGGISPSIATSASGDGSVVVGESTLGATTEAFLSTNGGTPVGIGHLTGPAGFSVANGISADGTVVVGGSDSDSGPQAFIWTSGGGMVGLGDLPGDPFDSIASGVSGDGTVVAGSGVAGPDIEAFIWTSGGGMVGIGDLPGGATYSRGNAISTDGTTVVGTSSASFSPLFEAFRWTSGGGMQSLGILPGTSQTDAFAVSGDGSAIVGNGLASPDQAFVWTADGGIRTIAELAVASDGVTVPLGWTLEHAYGISDNGGVIVGDGTNPDGDTEGWMLSLPDKDADGIPDYLDLHIPAQFIPPAKQGNNNYSHQLVHQGGTGPFTWTLVDGFLPSALTLGTDGVISGSVVVGGIIATFTAQVMDSTGETATRVLKIRAKIPGCYTCHDGSGF